MLFRSLIETGVIEVHTFAFDQSAGTQEKEVDSTLFGLNLVTNSIHVLDETRICLDEGELPLAIQILALSNDPVSGCLGATSEVDAGSTSVSRELFERELANAICCSDEDGYKSWEGRSNLGI